MKVKELDKTVNLAWSPVSQASVMLAAGTAAQQLDASFSTSATLDIYGLNLEEPGLDMELKSSIQSQNRFHKVVWGSCGGGVIVGGCDSGRLQMYNSVRVLAGDDGLLCAPERHTGPVKAIDFNSFQTNLLSSGASDSEIFIWDLNNVKTPMTPGAKSQPAEEVMCLAWNKQVQHILASAFATRCVVWDLRKNEPIIKLSDSNSRVRWKEVAWHPDIATQLCLASEEDSNPVIQLWDLRFATTPIKTFEGHQKGVLSIAWCAQDPELLISCGKDSRILCWNPAAAQQGDEIVCELVTSNQWNFEVTWCPRNPSLIATSSFDGHASIFTLVGGQQQMQTTNKIADSFPGMDQFAEAPVVQPPHHSHVAVELRKAPKWLKRPAGASFGFGGKLVSFGSSEGAVVYMSQVVTEPVLLDRSCHLQQLLSCGQLQDICHSKTDPVWSFVAASLEPDYRTAMRTLLGFTQEQLELNKYIGQPVNAKLGDVDGLTEDFSVLSQDGSDDEVRLMNNSSSVLGSFNIVQNNADQFNCFNKTEENSFEKKSPFKIKIGEDKEGVICRALLAGNLELAVDLCVQEGRMTDAIILAHTAGPDILASTQYKYFKQNQNYLSHLLSAIVTKDWSQVVSSCDLGSWAEALAAILTYATDDQLPALAERLGDRLEREGGADSRRNSEICFVAAGQLGHLIHNRIASDLSTDALQELVELVLVAKRGSVQDSGTAHLVDRYAQLLAAQGDFNTALAYLSTSQEEEIEELRERLYVASGQKPYPTPQRTQQNSYYQNVAQPGYANSYTKPMNQSVKQPSAFNQQLNSFPPANQQSRSSSLPTITPARKPSISNPVLQNSVPAANSFTPSSSAFPATSFPPTSSTYTSPAMFPPSQMAFSSQPQPPPPTVPPANFSATSAFAPPSSQKPFMPSPPVQPPIGTRTPVHFNSESLPPPSANAVPTSTFSLRSNPSPSLVGGNTRKYVVDPSVTGSGVGYGRTSATFNSNPYVPSPSPYSQPQPYTQPAYNAPPQPYNPSPAQPFNPPSSQPFNPPPSQPFNPPPSQPFNPPPSQPFNPPSSQPFNPLGMQSFNTPGAQSFNPPGAPPPMNNQPEPKLPQQFIPQTSAAPGWNDPPTLTGSKRSQLSVLGVCMSAEHAGTRRWGRMLSHSKPKEVHQPPPITHPLFATAGTQEMPLQGPPPPMQNMQSQGMDGYAPPQGMDGYTPQQGFGYSHAPAPPSVPVAKAAEPPRQKLPLPEEHMHLQTVFDELRNRCTCAANNPQLKRKLEDVARKLEVLYDALRENKMSNTTVGSLHQLVQMVQNGDYTGALHLHTQLVSGPDFSQISAFMPGLKVLIQSALQLGVYLQ